MELGVRVISGPFPFLFLKNETARAKVVVVSRALRGMKSLELRAKEN